MDFRWIRYTSDMLWFPVGTYLFSKQFHLFSCIKSDEYCIYNRTGYVIYPEEKFMEKALHIEQRLRFWTCSRYKWNDSCVKGNGTLFHFRNSVVNKEIALTIWSMKLKFLVSHVSIQCFRREEIVTQFLLHSFLHTCIHVLVSN